MMCVRQSHNLLTHVMVHSSLMQLPSQTKLVMYLKVRLLCHLSVLDVAPQILRSTFQESRCKYYFDFSVELSTEDIAQFPSANNSGAETICNRATANSTDISLVT